MHIEYHVGRDQRLSDNPRLLQACQGAEMLLPVYDLDPNIPYGPHRIAFLLDSLRALQTQLRSMGSDLLVRIQAPPSEVESYYRNASTLYDERNLTMSVSDLPSVFTSFRRLLEKHRTPVHTPVESPNALPPLPAGVVCPTVPQPHELGYPTVACDARSAFPYHTSDWAAGEHAATIHVEKYLLSHTVDTYKQTRNELIGTSFSSKLSPWLALGNISARTVIHKIREYEAQHGANDGTYWLWFELVWRDFFAFRGRQIGLTQPLNSEDYMSHHTYAEWCAGSTGCAFVDAAMKELAQTGWLSNRMRQIAASYLINELQLPWQWGEAWFAMQLIDYDPASNEGNWRYIAGQGADPRGGRHFSIEHQQQMYDPDQMYVRYWA